jgi:hypothetical protein
MLADGRWAPGAGLSVAGKAGEHYNTNSRAPLSVTAFDRRRMGMLSPWNSL